MEVSLSPCYCSQTCIPSPRSSSVLTSSLSAKDLPVDLLVVSADSEELCEIINVALLNPTGTVFQQASATVTTCLQFITLFSELAGLYARLSYIKK